MSSSSEEEKKTPPESKKQKKLKLSDRFISKMEKELNAKMEDRKWPTELRMLFWEQYAQNYFHNTNDEEYYLGNFTKEGMSWEVIFLTPSEEKLEKIGESFASIESIISKRIKLEANIRWFFSKMTLKLPRIFIEKDNFAFWEAGGIYDVQEDFELEDVRQIYPAYVMHYSQSFTKNQRIYLEIKSSLYDMDQSKMEEKIVTVINKFKNHLFKFRLYLARFSPSEKFILLFNNSDKSEIVDIIKNHIEYLGNYKENLWFTNYFQAFWINDFQISKAEVKELKAENEVFKAKNEEFKAENQKLRAKIKQIQPQNIKIRW